MLNRKNLIQSNEKLLNQVSINADPYYLPIEITVVGKFQNGTTKSFLESAFQQQQQHPKYLDEYHEQSALIGKPTFNQSKNFIDRTAIYTFGVDTRDLVFHRHVGHRVIVAITGEKGCNLKFSVCTPEELEKSPQAFFEKFYIVNIPGNRMFSLRFNGMIYHQFCPVDYTENAFFAVSVHTDETGNLSGELLEKVLANQGSIPLLTEPAPDYILAAENSINMHKLAKYIYLDC